jgi:hypothetical protein
MQACHKTVCHQVKLTELHAQALAMAETTQTRFDSTRNWQCTQANKTLCSTVKHDDAAPSVLKHT